MQRVGQFVDVEIEHLIAAAQGQLVAIPAGDGAMRLHRSAIMAGCAIDLINAKGSVGHRLIEITLIQLIIFRQVSVGVIRLRIKGSIAFCFIADVQNIGTMARLFKCLRDHQRDRLAEIIDLLCALRRRFIGAALRGSSQQAVVGNHRAHAILADDGAARHIGHPALGDRGADQHAIEHVGHIPFVGIGCLAGNLERTIGTIHR